MGYLDFTQLDPINMQATPQNLIFFKQINTRFQQEKKSERPNTH